MKSRLLLSAILAFAVVGMSAESRASDHHWKARHASHARHFYRQYYSGGVWIGGYRNFYQRSPATYSDTYGYPGFYNLQTFWERVQTQRNYPVQY